MACVVLAGTAQFARADEIGLFALGGAYHTNNAVRSNSDPRHDTVTYVTLKTYGKWDTGRLRSQWVLAEDAIKYLDSSFGSKAYGSAQLSVDYNLVPDLLVWNLRDSYGQMLITPSAPDTPLNRANFNVVSTGPSLHLPLMEATWLGAEAAYSDTYYEKQTLNGDKFDVEVGVNHNLDYKTDVGAYVGQSEGTYKSFGRFKTEDASLRFSAVGAFTTLKLKAGLNRAVTPIRTGNQPFVDLSMERATGIGSTFNLKLQRKITNPSEQFGQIAGGGSFSPGAIGGGVGNPLDISNTVSLFQTKYARIGYKTKRLRTEVELGISYRAEDSLAGTLREEHRRIKSVDALYHLIWGSKTGIVVYGSYEVHEGELFAGRVDRELNIGAEIAKPFVTPATRWVLTIERGHRTSNDSLNRYNELRIGAYVRFSKFVFNHVKE